MHVKKAFTMIELVFVIVVLGIVASIGSEIIVQVYESYIIQRATHNASLKSELAINQIANRLLYRIDKSVLARVPGNTAAVEGVDVYPLSKVPLGAAGVDTFTALEWIAYDNDGFTQSSQPAWSGFADLNASKYTAIVTTGSKLSNETIVLRNLEGNNTIRPAIVFAAPTYRENEDYTATCMYSQTGCIFPVTFTGDNNLTFTTAGTDGNRTAGKMVYSEFYKLAGSAYAIVPENNSTINDVNVSDLVLYSNYQPWAGENYTQGDRSLLIPNVSVFRFKQEPNSIRIKLCTVVAIGSKEQIATCKEKSVIR